MVEASPGAAASRAAWMIRAGSEGEAEQLCFEHGLCGIGWPDLPDLSVMGDEDVDHEIDVIYGDEPDGRVRNHKMQIRHFRSMAEGDVVLMPLKTKPGEVAVGRIVGPYEFRQDLSDLAHHVRATEWLGEVPKDLLAPIKSSLDRPLTISPTPASADQIELVLETGEPLPPIHDTAGGKLGGLLSRALQALQDGNDKDTLDETISEKLPQALKEMVGPERPIGYGVGVGRPAGVPWVSIHPTGSAAKGEEGIYAVYLFATDGSGVYLSLSQGTEKVRGGLNPLIKRARNIRAVAGLDSPGESIDLKKNEGRPARYQAASAYTIAYEAGAISSTTSTKFSARWTSQPSGGCSCIPSSRRCISSSSGPPTSRARRWRCTARSPKTRALSGGASSAPRRAASARSGWSRSPNS
jgi:restriction system protein